MSKKILVTGGAGFIGSCVLRILNDRGINNIVVVDQLGCTDKWKNLVGKQVADVIHKETLFDWLQGRKKEIGAIIHLGACSSTVEKDASYLLENNYRFSRKLAEYALPEGIRFIYASSAATYGDGSLGFSDEHATLTRYKPLNMYGYSKHLFDLWLYQEKLLDRVVGIKYFNVFGPNEYHKGRMSSAVLKMVPEVLKTGKICLFKSSEPEKYRDGEQVRDFLYVKDAAHMTVEFLNNAFTGIINLGTSIPRTWKALAQAVIKALGISATIEYIDMPADLVGKYQNYTAADLEKSKRHQLPLPRYSLEEGVEDYVKNYLLAEAIW